ncbi:MAG TPA: hypothetical protein VF191_07235 [Cyclobacteriaceae bacterium]
MTPNTLYGSYYVRICIGKFYDGARTTRDILTSNGTNGFCLNDSAYKVGI